MKVLAIESTCDETAAAVIQDVRYGMLDLRSVEVLSNIVASSAEIHIKYGGIVPEVAAREQIKAIIPVIKESVTASQVPLSDIDAIAVAVGPGLIGSLIIGVETAKTLALAWNKPLIPVNHMAAHIMANYIRPISNYEFLISKQIQNPNDQISKWKPPELPAIALVVSGGHTDLVYIKTMDDWEWVGGTRDDAAGECFDKCARLLGLPYPGGPSIERATLMANEHQGPMSTDEHQFKLPRPMIYEDNLEMSFSGLKSALDMVVRQNPEWLKDANMVNQLARELNEAVVEVLVSKTMRAVEQFNPQSVLLAGGVSANKRLREDLRSKVLDLGIDFYVPEFKYCTDNAAMIGAAGLMLYPKGTDPAVADHRSWMLGEDILSVRPDSGLETV